LYIPSDLINLVGLEPAKFFGYKKKHFGFDSLRAHENTILLLTKYENRYCKE